MFDDDRTGTGTKEWAETNVNIQVGCENDCLYCYAAHNANRFKSRERCEWATEELTKRAHITTYPKRKGVIMFPSSHDITPFNVDHYIRVARLILEKGNRLLIVTKPNREVMAKVMLSLMPWREQIMLRFTIGAINEELINLWEPGAPHPLDRLDTLADAERLRYKTSISIEPMLGGVEETIRVVQNVCAWNPETVWIGKMNRINQRVINMSEEVAEAVRLIQHQQRDEEIIRLYSHFKNASAIRWKDSIKEVIRRNGDE